MDTDIYRGLMNKKKQVLSGHKRVGKIFVPPMMRIPNVQQIGYVDNILPELIWIGRIYDDLGYSGAARFLENFFELVASACGDATPTGNMATASFYAQLTEVQRKIILDELEKIGAINNLRTWLEPLTSLYPSFPMAFFGTPVHQSSLENMTTEIKGCVGKYMDKHRTPGIMLNGAIMLSGLVSKKLHFSSDIDLPDFDSVIDNPDSDAAASAAGFIRAHALGEFGMRIVDGAWATYFCDRGIEISSCEFGEPDDEV